MNNDTREYIKKIDEHKNDMLVSYKGLVVAYEKCRQVYEKSIDEDTSTVRQCSQIVAYVASSNSINWRIVLLDGTVVYTSENKLSAETCIIDISKLGLPEGKQFKLQAYKVSIGPSTEDILEYKALSNTLYFSYDTSADGTGNNVIYRYTIESPLSPPIVKCSIVSIYNNASVLTKYEIRRVDGGKTVYTSGKYALGQTWSKNLSTLNIPVGTQLKLHAGVIVGDDSEPYAIIEYDPSGEIIRFTLEGTTFKTMFMVG